MASCQEYLESDQDVLFVLKVDMGNNDQQFITFRQNDTAEDLAFEFCKMHGLNIKVYDFIADALKQKYRQLQTGQLTESKSKKSSKDLFKAGTQQSKEKKTAAKSNRSERLDYADDSVRKVERSTAATAQHNLLASTSRRGLGQPVSPRPEERQQIPVESVEVYDRLFADAKIKQTSDAFKLGALSNTSRPRSAESSRMNTSGVHASNRLYYGGVRNKSIRDKEYSHIKQLKDDMNMNGATFKPKINRVSRIIAESKSQQHLKPVHERLIESGKNAQQKKSLYRDIKEEIDRAECKFKPRIDPV